MAKFVKGDVVVVPFPFSDLSQSKKRPALVVASPSGNDLILCQITSRQISDKYAIPLDEPDYDFGSLKLKSNIRPNRIFTADESIILYKAARLKLEKLNIVIDSVIQIIKTQ